MNPNREHLDDEVSVEVDAVGDFRTWLNGPPRQRKRDVIGFIAGVGFLGAMAIAGPEGDSGATFLWGVLAATIVSGAAEVLPLGAANSARVLRVIGLLAYVAMIVWMVASVLGE